MHLTKIYEAVAAEMGAKCNAYKNLDDANKKNALKLRMEFGFATPTD